MLQKFKKKKKSKERKLLYIKKHRRNRKELYSKYLNSILKVTARLEMMLIKYRKV